MADARISRQQVFAELMPLMDETYLAYEAGDVSRKREFQDRWNTTLNEVMADNRPRRFQGTGIVMMAAITGGVPPDLMGWVFVHPKYIWLARDWAEVVKVTKVTPEEYTRDEAERCLEALAKHRGFQVGGGSKFTAAAAQHVATSGLGSNLRNWFEHKDEWADREDRDEVKEGVDKYNQEQQQRQRERASQQAPPAPDYSAQITALEQQKAAAVTAEDFDTAKRLTAEIATLREQMAKAAVEQQRAHMKEGLSLEDQIAALEQQKVVAVTAEDYDLAKRLTGEIATLREQMGKVDTVVQITEIERQKAEAIAAEDYDLAKRLTGEIAALREQQAKAAEPKQEVPDLVTQIAQLEGRKAEAIAAEDYDLAKRLTGEIAALREQQAKAAGHHTNGHVDLATLRKELVDAINASTKFMAEAPRADALYKATSASTLDALEKLRQGLIAMAVI